MIKTQIQFPDELYRRIKRFAQEREWSLAETLRRGAELVMEVYPPSPSPAPWSPPHSSQAGWQGLTPEELRNLALKEMEPALPPAR